MKITINYRNLSGTDFDRDVFESLVGAALAKESINLHGLKDAGLLAATNKCLVEDWNRKYHLLHNVRFCDFKPGLLDRLLLELGTALGEGITITQTEDEPTAPVAKESVSDVAFVFCFAIICMICGGVVTGAYLAKAEYYSKITISHAQEEPSYYSAIDFFQRK